MPQRHSKVTFWPDLSQAQPPCLARLDQHRVPDTDKLWDTQSLLRSWPTSWSCAGQLSSKFPCLWPLFPCWAILYQWKLELCLCGWRRWRSWIFLTLLGYQQSLRRKAGISHGWSGDFTVPLQGNTNPSWVLCMWLEIAWLAGWSSLSFWSNANCPSLFLLLFLFPFLIKYGSVMQFSWISKVFTFVFSFPH